MPILSFLLFVFVTSFTPGPNNIMAMVFANNYGFKKTLNFCLGVCAGFFLIMIMSTYFNLVLQSALPKIESTMRVLGTIYMFYLAIKIIVSKDGESDREEDNQNRFATGMLLQFANPKAILYGLTAIGTFILPYYTGKFSLFLFAIFLAFIGFSSTLTWSLFGSVFQKHLAKYRSSFNLIMALLLMYSATSMWLT